MKLYCNFIGSHIGFFNFIRHERQTQKNNNKNKQRQERARGREAIVKGWELNYFVVHFKLGFLQLRCKDSLIFKSNLQSASSIILKQGELYKSKHVAVDCRCLKIWDLLSFLICSSVLVLKWRQVSPI